MGRPKRDYPVGYGKPPEHSRFPEGQSGNPQGRPRGAKNLKTLFEEALQAQVTVTENGRRLRISKLEAAFLRLANGASRGDPKSIQTVLGLLSEIERHSDAPNTEPISLTEADRQVLQFIRKRRLAE